MPISGTFLQENYQPIDISTDHSSTRPLIQAENQLHLAKSQSHRLTKIDLQEKIKRIRKENEEIGQQAKKSSQTHERIIQSVNSASKQAEEDLQKVGSIRRCQNNLAQKMSFLEKDFGEFHIRASKEHAKVYCNIAWTYIKEEVHPITWIAIGIIASYLASLAIKTFPLTTLMVGGITFIVVRNIVMPTIELINS